MAKKQNAVQQDQTVTNPAAEPVKPIEVALREIFGAEITEEQVVAAVEAFGKATGKIKAKKLAKTWRVVSVEFQPKTPTQMMQAVLAIQDKGPVNMEAWVAALEAHDGFKTKQPTDRIIAFYKARMIKEGLVEAV